MQQGTHSCLRDFDVLSKLGEGAFGIVFKVKRKFDGKQYALKKVKIGTMKEKERENALNEVRILASYGGDYIIGYKEAFYDETSATLCMVMEFASGGDLSKKVSTHTKNRTKFKEQQIWKALVHIVKGLKSLHDRKILHRDLKCANIFIDADGVYKLGDLNVSKVLKKDLAHTQTGTPYYASPEVWKDQPYDAQSDMWSLGCILYEMAALRPPFMASDLSGLYRKVCAGMFQRIPMTYTSQLSSVINSLLKVDPKKRPGPSDILNNPVIQKRYKGEIVINDTDNDCDELLKTIKYNPRDLRGLKKILPEPNYEQRTKQTKQQRKLEDMRGGVNSCKNSRKSAEVEIANEDKLKNFLEKRRVMEDREREKQLNLKEQKGEPVRNRERVLSACGVRQPYMCYSPRIAVHHKKDSAYDLKDSARKGAESRNMPPRVPKQQQGGNQGINYKLPPRPAIKQQSRGSKNADYRAQKRSSQEKSSEKVSTDRDQSKQNLKKAGERIVSSRGLPRSNSSQRVIYPTWWG